MPVAAYENGIRGGGAHGGAARRGPDADPGGAVDEPTNILVVDDLPEKLLVYRTILEDLGQNLVMVGSGEDALREVLRQDFAVILLDVKMPGMSGLEAAALIRKRKRSAHTPIIFVTAFGDEMRAAEGYAQGAVDYITTPIVPAILRAKVRVFTDLYRMTQQVRRQAEERVALAEERTRRAAAEEANQRLSLLAGAAEVLGQSLEVRVTARDVIRVAVPGVADSAALVFPAEAGRPARCLRGGPGAPGAAVEESQDWPAAADAELAPLVERAFASGAPAREASAAAVPLRSQGRTLAVLALSRAASGRPFAEPDLTLAEAYASRAAVALENARLYQEVQQADRQKNEFLSMLAHELRNPLAPIRSANEVLRMGGANPDGLRWAQGVIDRQLTHLVRLVDDLLDVSRLTLGKIRLVVEPVELASVVEQAVEAVRPLVEQAGHRLVVELPAEPVALSGDKARLTQVLTNLLNNAVKYSDRGAAISVAAVVEGAEAVVRVFDTGIGIPADLLPRVFDLFTQANRSLDRSQGGLGVGLTLVRRLVEMHGGSVEARSDGPGRGSEFVVRLPVVPVEAVAPPAGRAPEATPAPAGSLRVVVVDDNVDGAESLATLLELLGHTARTAHDGPTGIEVVREFDPDVVFLDIGLPRMDGYEVARRLRGDLRTRAVLAAVSGYGRDDDRRKGREAGFEYHFVKPVDFAVLRAFFDTLCAARRV
jgi:signal transduction histidine kinase/DNA-binding response OmpR family regulator